MGAAALVCFDQRMQRNTVKAQEISGEVVELLDDLKQNFLKLNSVIVSHPAAAFVCTLERLSCEFDERCSAFEEQGDELLQLLGSIRSTCQDVNAASGHARVSVSST